MIEENGTSDDCANPNGLVFTASPGRAFLWKLATRAASLALILVALYVGLRIYATALVQFEEASKYLAFPFTLACAVTAFVLGHRFCLPTLKTHEQIAQGNIAYGCFCIGLGLALCAAAIIC